MVLHWLRCGRVGRRRTIFFDGVVQDGSPRCPSGCGHSFVLTKTMLMQNRPRRAAANQFEQNAQTSVAAFVIVVIAIVVIGAAGVAHRSGACPAF